MKKALFFLMLMLTVSITAQNSFIVRPQTLKHQDGSKQDPATNESSQLLRKPSAMQQKLQADRKKVSQSKDTAVPLKIKRAKMADISWINIGTLSSWTETIEFDPANEELIPIQFMDEYGYTINTFCYAVQFTLEQDELVTAMSSSGKNDFTIYSDSEAQQEVAWSYGLVQPLKAGVYYLLISDSGYLEWTDPFQASIELQVAPTTNISLPYQESVNITQENSILIANVYHTVFYKFTLSEDAIVNLGSSWDEEAMGEYFSYFELNLVTENYMIYANNSDIPLKAGDYYLAAYGIMWDDEAFWVEHSSLEAQLDIRTKTLDAPGVLSVPYEQDFSMATNNAYNLFDYKSLLYSLHLDGTQIIEIDPGDQWAVIIYDKKTWNYIQGFYPGQTAIVQLKAGDYYMAIVDYNRLYDGETPVNGHLSIRIPLSYATLDFSEIIAVGETKIGDDASLISVITDVGGMGVERKKVAAYHFNVQMGHIYKLVMECYAKTSPMQPTLALFRAPNTGDIYADNIQGAMPYINATSGTGSLTLQADFNGDVNVMFFFERPESDVMFNLTLEEIETTHTDTPAYEDITLPFVSWLHFDPAYNAYWNESTSEYYKLYRLMLSEKTLLKIDAGFNRKQGSSMFLKIFTDENRTQPVGDSWGYGEGSSLLLDAGTYYLAMSDYEYFKYNEEYAECLVELSGSTDFDEIPTVTVAQLMDDPAIPVISYVDNLSYTDQGYFVYGTSKLVNDPNFYASYVFANGYKLTGMNVGDEVHVVDRQPAYEYESWLSIYQKESNGSYRQLAENSYDWDDPFLGTTHIKFTATEARDYYIMASTSNPYPGVYSNVEYPSYQVAIWAGATEDEPAPDDLQLPDEVIIASTAANATEVNVSADASSTDVKLALMALEVTATTQAGTTVVLENNPMSWEVNDLVMEASFVVIPRPYLVAETYNPAIVQIKSGMGINNAAPEAIRIINSGNGLFTITGLQGKEAISLIDINGRIVRKTTAQGVTATIEANVLPNGVYIVAVQNSKKLTVLKFIK